MSLFSSLTDKLKSGINTLEGKNNSPKPVATKGVVDSEPRAVTTRGVVNAPGVSVSSRVGHVDAPGPSSTYKSVKLPSFRDSMMNAFKDHLKNNY